MTLLTLTSLRKQYGSVAALDGIDLSVTAGSRTAIVGPSGCGKTTLLRLVAGFDAPDGGRIVFDGRTLADSSSQVPAHKRGIGIVAQDGCLFPHLTIRQNIGFGLEAEASVKNARIAELMDMVGLDPAMLARKPDQLSGGQQQRVALARALARKPRLMLLDEPFSALDTGLRAATRKAVTDVLTAAGITTLLVTHDQGEALAFADQVAVMRAGRFAQVGSPREVYSRPVDAATAAFLGEAIVLPADIADGQAKSPLGVLPVDDVAYRGKGEIMLRPEQVTVMQDNGSDSSKGASGTITDINFCGPTSDVRIRLGSDPQGFSFRLDIPSREALAAGDRVTIGVAGAAHLFR
ncbi:ABC transporter ATP-binding protein [Neorhizobium galegae]|uniref:Fe(3+) ions import ATP-binding protein FbpC n=1 Tax=Neorhizobium galegae bv. orientalis str. HAMBI 540 TaxID=1028800 RepID=A0A068STS2_NEOGA|nr:ABC transporter ATP-binding protein [Neorhizobium galegae]MCQ1850524.1 ABC transporter ATP-binding protein [Neorhizobium galegae]CDN49264.1 Fe(3+) ions import ATP-binding protein FbpC [Neorhizobium galegae bv. orientalis str. HAMBI 540]CDZ47491.1 Fe(3+) ions import ATP-binding protein FbpC [Neorhizobium galegae bv. orientalis]